LDDWGFKAWKRLGIFLFTIESRLALGPTQLPIQWEPGALSLGVKLPGHEATHSPPSSAKVKECMELYLHSPILQAQGQLYLYLYINTIKKKTDAVLEASRKVGLEVYGCVLSPKCRTKSLFADC
jgi:hypothetical protein